jgi:hypothetical protein
MKLDADDTNLEISYDNSEDPTQSTMSSDIQEDNLATSRISYM